MIARAVRRALSRNPLGKAPVAGAERAASVPAVARSGIFDAAWYRAQGGSGSGLAAVVDYVVRGRRSGLSPHPLFEPEWYDPAKWRRPGADPVWVHLREGRDRSTSPLLDPDLLAATVPDALTDRRGPLGALLAALGPDDALPTPLFGGGRPVVSRRDGTAAVEAADARWREQEAVRRLPRLVDRIDTAEASTFVARWSAAPVRGGAPGQPLVSVVMPVRDRADVVGEAIRSVQRQTLADWELIVVDDGSTDATPDVVAALAAADPRITLLRTDAGGVSAARNAGQARARGHWLAWLDSDNTWRPEFLHCAIAALQAWNARGGYAMLEQRDGATVRYRALAEGRDLLTVQNHIDLNVLVVERTAVEQVGGFDVRLRRAVDYDLVLRLLDVVPLRHLPFVGADYDESRDRADRLTVRERRSWTQVVRDRHFVPWQRLREQERVAGRTSVVIPVREDWRVVHRCLDALVRHSPADTEFLVVDGGGRRGLARILGATAALDPRIRTVRWPMPATPGLALDLGLAETSGDVVVLLEPTVVVGADWVEPLRDALDGGASAAAPVLVGPDGVVVSAGLTFPGGQPERLLAGHPREDAWRAADGGAGGGYPVAAVGAGAVAVRAADLLAVEGVDAIYTTPEPAVADLCLRLAAATGRPVRTTSAVVMDRADADVDRVRPRVEPADDAATFAERWSASLPAPDLAPRERALARVQVGEQPVLRWAIRTSAWAGERGEGWGDVHFARALARALQRLGQHVAVDAREAHARPTAALDDVVLGLRGLLPVAVQPGAVNLLWIISHPDRVSDDELRAVDAAYAAGATWAAEASTRVGRPVEPLLQCTDPALFAPDGERAEPGDDLLFVGNSRGVHRPTVRFLREAGVDLAVYGRQWEQFLGVAAGHGVAGQGAAGQGAAGHGAVIKGQHIPNDRLAAHYRSAGIVLSDHWPDMRAQGFLANRLFDAAACGARLVSDDVPGIEELFGGLVRTWATPQQLVEIVTGDRDRLFPPEQERRAVAERVRAEHSFDARAATLLEAALRLRRR